MGKKVFAAITMAALLALANIGNNIRMVSAAARVVLSLEYDGVTRLYDEENVTLYVNGTLVKDFGSDMPPIILDDRLYLPVRDIFEMLGAEVSWNEATQQTYVAFGGRIVGMRDSSSYINLDGELINLPLSPKIINRRMMAPVSFILGAFGFTVEWIQETRTAIIGGGTPVSTPSPGVTIMEPDYTQIPKTPGGDNNNTNSVTASAIDENVSAPITLEHAVDADPRPLLSENHGLASLTGIRYDKSNPRVFNIEANSPISRVEKFVLPDNRLVLDIYNCEKMVEETVFEIEENPLIQRIRVGQNQVEPDMVTRVVFDLSEPVSYSVDLSENREKIIVTFLRNEITDVQFSSDGYADYVRIYGSFAPVVNVFPQTVENVFIIDVPLGVMESTLNTPVGGAFAKALRTEQFDPATARIMLDMKYAAAYDVSYEGDCTVVTLTRPTYHNIAYDSAAGVLVIPRASGLNLDTSKIVHKDDYLNYQYSFEFPGDYSAYFGEGDYIVKDKYINYINISTAKNKTVIRFYEQQIMAYQITEDYNNIYIHAMLPREKYDKIIIIDPGHGGRDPGVVKNNAVEKTLNLDIASRLVKLLEGSGIKVYMSRTGDTGPTPEERAAFANGIGDLFVSLHNNSNDSASPYGTEVYYYPHDNDSAVGYTSKRAAEIMQRNIVKSLSSKNRDYKMFEYRVLVHTEIPAVLVEFGFLSNADEAAKLKTEAYRQKCAEGAYNGIIEIFKEYKPLR